MTLDFGLSFLSGSSSMPYRILLHKWTFFDYEDEDDYEDDDEGDLSKTELLTLTCHDQCLKIGIDDLFLIREFAFQQCFKFFIARFA